MLELFAEIFMEDLWILYDKKSELPEIMNSVAKSQNIKSKDFYFEDFCIEINNNVEKLYYKNKEVKKLPKIILFKGYEFDLAEYFKSKNVILVNNDEQNITIRDKWKTHLCVKELNIQQPKTLIGKNLSFGELSKKLGLPFVMKDRMGQEGKCVYLVNSENELKENLNENPNLDFIFQEYIDEKGKDIRFYIIGNKIYGPIQRDSMGKDFRSNLSQGGKAYLIDAPIALKKAALKIAKHLKLNCCSVDFMQEKDKFYFCEANSNASFVGFWKNGIDICTAIMQYIKTKLS